MHVSPTEHPTASPPPVFARCADLPKTLVGADPDAVERVASSLAGQLQQLGWQTVSDTPGLRMFSRNGRMLAIDQLLGMLASGNMSANNWAATCATDGIADLVVPVPAPRLNSSELVDPFSLPVALHSDPGMTPPNNRANVARIAVLILLALVAVGLELGVPWYQQSHLAGHNQPKTEKEVKADGMLSANNGAATAQYVKRKREFESISVKTSDLYYDDLSYREGSMLSNWNSHGRDLTEIIYTRGKFDLDTPRGLALWLNNRNVGESQEARALLKPKAVSLGGRKGWAWEYVTPKGWWIYSVRFPQGKEAYNFYCRVMPGDDAAERQARCKSVANTLRFRGAAR